MYQQTSRNIYIYIHFSYITCDDDNTYMWCVYNVLCMCVCVCVSWSHIYIQTIFLLLIILCPFITFIWDLQKKCKPKKTRYFSHCVTLLAATCFVFLISCDFYNRFTSHYQSILLLSRFWMLRRNNNDSRSYKSLFFCFGFRLFYLL